MEARIARQWHGAVPEARADVYLDYLRRTGVRDLRATPGNRGVQVLCSHAGGIAHFQLTSFWDSEEAIRRFAGDDLLRARYYPEDADFLIELEPRVVHWEVAEPAP